MIYQLYGVELACNGLKEAEDIYNKFKDTLFDNREVVILYLKDYSQKLKTK